MSVIEEEEGNSASSAFVAKLNTDRIKKIIEYQKSLLDRYITVKNSCFYKKYMEQLEMEHKLLQEMIKPDYESSGLDTDSNRSDYESSELDSDSDK
jgi:hypothetical protein